MNKLFKTITAINFLLLIFFAVNMFSGFSTAEDAVYFGKDNYLLSNSTDFKLVIRDTARVTINKNTGLLTHISGVTIGDNANGESQVTSQMNNTGNNRQNTSEFELQGSNPVAFRDDAVTIYYKTPYIVFGNNEDGTIKIDLTSGFITPGTP